MRLFVAADLSREQIELLREKVAEAQFAAPFDYIRWIPESNWHATLCFIGDKQEEELEAVTAQIDAVLSKPHTLIGQPSRIQAFPHRDKPRLLAFKLYPEAGIQELHWNLTQALGTSADRNFRLHVTVARFRDLGKEDANSLNHAIRDLSMAEPVPWLFPQVTLYESVLKQAGAEYRAIKCWPSTPF